MNYARDTARQWLLERLRAFHAAEQEGEKGCASFEIFNEPNNEAAEKALLQNLQRAFGDSRYEHALCEIYAFERTDHGILCYANLPSAMSHYFQGAESALRKTGQLR